MRRTFAAASYDEDEKIAIEPSMQDVLARSDSDKEDPKSGAREGVYSRCTPLWAYV